MNINTRMHRFHNQVVNLKMNYITECIITVYWHLKTLELKGLKATSARNALFAKNGLPSIYIFKCEELEVVSERENMANFVWEVLFPPYLQKIAQIHVFGIKKGALPLIAATVPDLNIKQPSH